MERQTATSIIAKSEKLADESQIIEGKKLNTTPKVESIINKPNAISPVETRLLDTTVEVKPYRYMHMEDSAVAMIRESNVYNYYKQINHNLIIGAKALFLVCRDLKEASVKLGSDDFKVLKDSLPMTDSTISKYIKIAESDVCRKLYIENKLPESWTTMYAITTVEDQDEKQTILKNVTVNTTMEDINNLLNKVKKAVVSLFNFNKLKTPKEFLRVAIESNKDVGQVDPNALLLIKDRVERAVKEAMKDYKEHSIEYKLEKDVIADVSVNEDLISTSRENILKYFNKTKKKGYVSFFLNKFKELTKSPKTIRLDA